MRAESRCHGYGKWAIVLICLLLPSILPLSALPQTAPDKYEPDDSVPQARHIFLNAVNAQRHNFDKEADEDWIKFHGLPGESYEFWVKRCESRCRTVLELYDSDGVTLLTSPRVAGGYGQDNYLSWRFFPREDVYFLRVRQVEPSVFGEYTGYSLRALVPVQGGGSITGYIWDAGTGYALAGVTVQIGSRKSVTKKGYYDYFIRYPAGTWTLTAQKPGYWPVAESVEILNFQYGERRDFYMYRIIAPDLVVTAATGPARGTVGSTIQVTNGVKNRGNGAAGASEAGIYLYSQSIGYVQIASRTVPDLAPGVESREATSVTIPLNIAPGTYSFLIHADGQSQVAESNENNNWKLSSRQIVIQ